ncbi:MAG: CBS domain-containing protein [Verrucomicrobia bacterium]|nr:CBS domain-containing protein [Cytophagales bacterium]
MPDVSSYFYDIFLNRIFHVHTLYLLLLLLVLVISLYYLFLNNSLKISLFVHEESPVNSTNFSLTQPITQHLLQNPNVVLMSLLITNLSLYTLILSLTYALASLISWEKNTLHALALAGSSSFLIVLFGEIIPKMQTLQKPSKSNIRFLNNMIFLFKPLVAGFIWIDALLEKNTEKKEKQAVIEERNDILEEPENQEGKEILRGIFNFSQILVRQIMQPRMEITAFSSHLNFYQLLNKINKFAYSRIPVYTESLDKIEGILYIKDILPFIRQESDFNWQKFVRPAYFVPENKKIEELLQDFQQKRVHIAIVADEYGGTSGLVTLDDIIEQIMGVNHDEFDEKENLFRKTEESTYIFEAKIPLLEFCREMNVEMRFFEEVQGESETLAGLVLELFGRLPKTGEKTEFEQFLFTIISADVKKIRKIQVQIAKSEEK